ncbi:MAG: insulinase family protein [Clostridia bacterium]|nr:insulinase family protein [Clostridia bacterium]
MRKTVHQSERLREQYTKITHGSGLDIYVFPKQLTTTFAFFATKYGAVDNCFKPLGANEFIRVPDGVAHFLEHKLFANADGSDSFETFGRLGADSNAYTSHHRTAYLFSCTENFEASLTELLTFVTHPYFTDESVGKEQGIIAEEIRMGDDHPGNRRYYQLLRAMYSNPQIYTPICGTVESIAEITPQTLYDCYHAFYQLSNMALVVCGNVDIDSVLAVADRVLEAKPAVAIERFSDEDEDGVCMPMVSCRMDVSKPIFTIGIKDNSLSLSPVERVRREIAFSILCEMLFNQSSRLYTEMYREGLITGSLGYGYDNTPSFAFVNVSGESDSPEIVLERVKQEIEQMRKEGPDEARFMRYKRVMYADFVRNFDSTAEIADLMLDCVFFGVEPLSYLDLIDSVTCDDLRVLLDTAFQPDRFAMSVIYPKED